jgi:hypothetical protein
MVPLDGPAGEGPKNSLASLTCTSLILDVLPVCIVVRLRVLGSGADVQIRVGVMVNDEEEGMHNVLVQPLGR